MIPKPCSALFALGCLTLPLGGGAQALGAQHLAAASNQSSSDSTVGPASTVATISPISYLETHDARVKAILDRGDSLSAARRQQVKDEINAVFDFEELGRLALGDHWDERTDSEQVKFVETFGGIISEKNFDTFVKYYREGEIVYRSEEVTADKAVVAAAVPLDREEVAISYMLHRSTGGWRVYDLVIDDASTASGYRRSYARHIAKHSYEWLIGRLEKQLARIQAE